MTRHRQPRPIPGTILGSGHANEIAPGLLQGGLPRYPERLAEDGIDVIVLSAREFQPDSEDDFPGVEIIAVPLDDDYLGPTKAQASAAVMIANEVIRALEAGKTVLITCAMGWNRSGMISALTLIGRYGMSGSEAVNRVRTARPMALSNPGFVDFLQKIPARGEGR